MITNLIAVLALFAGAESVIIDRVFDGAVSFAVIEFTHAGRTSHEIIHLSLLPKEARGGDVLTLIDGEVRIDPVATQRRRTLMQDLRDRLPTAPKGDLIL